MREVVWGDKHNLRKSSNRNAQISVIHSPHCTDLCFAICRFSQVVFITSNNFTHNLLFYFQQFLVLIWFLFSILAQYLLLFHPSCLGMCWATARSQQLLFAVLTAGVKNAFIHHSLLLYTHTCTHIDTSPHILHGIHTHTHAHFLVAHKFHSHICTHIATYTYKFPTAYKPTYYP